MIFLLHGQKNRSIWECVHRFQGSASVCSSWKSAEGAAVLHAFSPYPICFPETSLFLAILMKLLTKLMSNHFQSRRLPGYRLDHDSKASHTSGPNCTIPRESRAFGALRPSAGKQFKTSGLRSGSQANFEANIPTPQQLWFGVTTCDNVFPTAVSERAQLRLIKQNRIVINKIK